MASILKGPTKESKYNNVSEQALVYYYYLYSTVEQVYKIY